MPTPQDLERLRALLAQLTTIGDAQRGELIRADDWNTLVAAVEDIARAVLAVDPAVAVPAHGHPDQVTSAWLSPDLRDLLQRGPLADPAAQKRLTEIERTLRRTGETQDANDKKVEEFRGRLTDVAARDVERQAALTSVRRAVDGVADPRPELQNMRASLGTIQRDMSTVLEAASGLTVDGAVVDLGSVVTRVADLEQLRERLRGANGELLDAATIETRIAEIANRAVLQDQLDGILDTREFTVSDAQLAGIETRLGGQVREQFNGVLDGFRTEIRGDVTTQLDGVGALVNTRVSDALPGLTQSVVSTMTPQIATARQAAVQEAAASAQRAIESADAATRAAVTGQIAEATANLSTQVQAQIAQRLATALAATDRAIADTAARLDALTADTARLGGVQNNLAAGLAAIPQQMVALRAELRETVLSEVNLRTSALTRSLDEQLSAFTKRQSEQFDTLARDLRARAADEARRAGVETAQNESRLLRAQLLAETRVIAREEVTAATRDQVRVAVNDAVRAQFAAVPGMISAEVRRVTTREPR